MKQLLAALLALIALSSHASTDVYTCTSNKGKVTVKDYESGMVSLDLTDHNVILMENAVFTLANTLNVPSEFYKDYILRLSPETIQKRPGVKLANTFGKTFFKTELSIGVQNCVFGLNLNKTKEVMKLSYACATLFKQHKAMEDSLECNYTEEE